MTVDEFVKTKVAPEHRPVVAALRKLIREHAPKAREVMSYGLPMYYMNAVIAWISPSRSGIALTFQKGVYLEDRYGLLRNPSKHSKQFRMKTLADLNEPALKYYIKQAVKLDKA